MAIPQAYIYELCQRSDITDVVSSYVQLKRRGRTQVGLCPFHNEKTPSFVVYPETQSFYCFGCGAGGDVITFIKKINNLDYIEAVKFLAARAGMPLPEENDETGKLRSRVLAINKAAARFFVEALNTAQGAPARAYLRRRALSDGTIRRFGLGFAPDSFHALIDSLKRQGFTEEEMLAASVAKRSAKGNLYDIFRNRVMFPIIDLRGNVIAFGGRNMGDEKPKYLNSPETIVFKKSRGLFAMNIAKKSKSRRYLLVEGYMDVISLHQAGFDTAIASLGTALTAEQAKLISDYADEVVLCYDSDEAGQKATARAIDIFSKTPVKVTVLSIEGAKDPDEFIQKYGAERFEQMLSGSGNSIEYALGKVRAKYDLAQPDGRVEYLKEAIEVLCGPLSATERAVYTGRLAEETDVPRNAIEQQLNGRLRARQRRAAKEREKKMLTEGAVQRIKVPYTSAQGAKPLAAAYAEQQLMAAVFADEDNLNKLIGTLLPEQFITPEMQAVYRAVLSLREEGAPITLAAAAPLLEEGALNLLSKILADNAELHFGEEDLEMYLDRVKNNAFSPQLAADMSADEWTAYMEQLKNKKV